MRYFSFIFLLLFLSSFANGTNVHAKHDAIKVKVVTEDTFPLQYLEGGKVVGPATALVEQVLSMAGITYSIDVLPWARAYHLALNEPNILIYSLAKTPARAEQFKWVGEIMALDYYLYGAIDSEINAQTSLEKLKQYKIGTVRDSAVYQYLIKNDFKHLTTVVQGKQNLLLFEQNRIDLFPANKSTFQVICRQEAFNCRNIKPVYKLDISSIDLYMAFSQSTDNAIVEKVRAGYQAVIQKQHNSSDVGID